MDAIAPASAVIAFIAAQPGAGHDFASVVSHFQGTVPPRRCAGQRPREHQAWTRRIEYARACIEKARAGKFERRRVGRRMIFTLGGGNT